MKKIILLFVSIVSIVAGNNVYLSTQNKSYQNELHLEDIEADGLPFVEAIAEYYIFDAVNTLTKPRGTYWRFEDHFTTEVHIIDGQTYTIFYQFAHCEYSNGHEVVCQYGDIMKIEKKRVAK